jgi:hypothetical protein
MMKTSKKQRAAVETYEACETQETSDSRIEELVKELIGRVADKWSMIIIEVLTERGELRPLWTCFLRSCYLPHHLLLVFFQVFHIQVPSRLDPVLVHLYRQRPHQA